MKKRYKVIAINIIVSIMITYFSPLLAFKTVAYTEGDEIPTYYNLKDDIDITVKNQYQNGICYMVATSSMWETHIKLRKNKYNDYSFYNKTPVFSMLTSTASTTFDYIPISIDDTEKVIKDYYNDDTYTEDKVLKNTTDFKIGNLEEKLKLITQELQETNNENNGTSLEKIKKSISSDGKMIYKDTNGNTLSDEEVLKKRESYKKFILKNGGLVCSICTEGFKDANISDEGLYEGTPTSDRKVCYYTGNKGSNHVVLIIGWDDNFSKDNFPEDNRPQKDGAYIVLNSWGSEWGENGVFYLSYEDIYCESNLAGLTQVSEYEDTVKPEINFELNNEKIKIKCTDEYGSGIDESSLKYMWLDHNMKPDVSDEGWKSFVNNLELTYEESKYLWVVAKDKAGNQSLINNRHNESNVHLYIDRDDIDKNKNPIWTKSATIEITQSDLEKFELSVWSDTISDDELKNMLTVVDSGGIYQYILKVNKNGIHTINYAIKNKKDGYEEIGESITVKVDKIAPTSPSITLSGIGKESEYQKGATITIKSGTDNGSGVSKTEIEILDENGKNIEVDNKFEFKLDKTGQYTIKAITYDVAGNKSNETKLSVKIIDYTLTINEKNDNTVNVVDGEDVTAKIICSNSTTSIGKYKVKVYCKDDSFDLEDTQEIFTEDATTNEITIPSTDLWGDTISVTGYALDSTNKVIGTTSTINIKLNTPVTLGKIGNQTVEEGQNVTFKVSITKDGDPSEYIYQWYKNSANNTIGGTKIAGAESASYTVKATSDLNGKYFYCVVKNGICTTTTNAAKLTVEEVQPVLVKNIKLSQKDLTLNNAVKSTKLIATIEPEDATEKGLKWKSSNEKVAKVDQNGVVTAVANGTAQITVEATDGSGVSTTITCKVIEHTNPTGIEIQGKNRVRKDEKYTYTVKYTPEDANINKDVKWTVNDEEIATINSETGEVEGKKAGKVTITASLKKIENVVATKEIEVYYENPTTAEPSATVTTNSIKVENKQTNEYAEIVKVEYGISENGEDWRWQESNKFEGLTEDKEYKIKTRATDENGATSESEILEVKTNKLELGKLLLKNDSDGYEEGTWTNSNVSYELVDEKNLTTVKILNENNEVVDIENNEIKDSGVYTILVEITDGTNKKSKEYKVKIDKGTAELIINKDSEEEVELVKLKVKLEGSISGIKSLKVNGVDVEYNNDEIMYEVTENGTYKFEVEDNAGNIIERSIEVSNIKKKDAEVPKDDENKTDTKTSNNEKIEYNQSNINKTEDKKIYNNTLPQTGEKDIIYIVIFIGIIMYAIRTYIKNKKLY